jgi:hypothetical protein
MPENKLDKVKLQRVVDLLKEGETIGNGIGYAATALAIFIDQSYPKRRGKVRELELQVKADVLSAPYVVSCKEGRG